VAIEELLAYDFSRLSDIVARRESDLVGKLPARDAAGRPSRAASK
jgi:hypothetical protein